MNSFQTIILGIFGFFIIIGLVVVATQKSKGGPEAAQVSMWGTTEREAVEEIVRASFDPETLKVAYREVSESALDQELIEALAAGRGPDMLLLPLDLLARYIDKLQFIPYTSYSERSYKDTFIQEADLFLFSKGIAALPFSVDPLIMYFNRDLLDEGGIAQAPKFWAEFLAIGNEVTQKDDDGNISRSAVALGEYRNISFAREILATLFMQGGNPIVDRSPSGTKVTFTKNGTGPILDFYTEFANPLKPSYSWNRSLPNSRSAFLSSKLAIYFGMASEYEGLLKANPNLNFDVAVFPRPRSASVGITYGKLTGVAILRTTSSPSTQRAALPYLRFFSPPESLATMPPTVFISRLAV